MNYFTSFFPPCFAVSYFLNYCQLFYQFNHLNNESEFILISIFESSISENLVCLLVFVVNLLFKSVGTFFLIARFWMAAPPQLGL